MRKYFFGPNTRYENVSFKALAFKEPLKDEINIGREVNQGDHITGISGVIYISKSQSSGSFSITDGVNSHSAALTGDSLTAAINDINSDLEIDLKDSSFYECDFTGNDFKSQLIECEFYNCDLNDSTIRNSCTGTDFIKCHLAECVFTTQSSLENVNLGGSILYKTKLQYCSNLTNLQSVVRTKTDESYNKLKLSSARKEANDQMGLNKYKYPP